MEFKKPDCSQWNIWSGIEIEGTTDVGMKTLFVRKGRPEVYYPDFERVWFCKEFMFQTDWQEQIENAVDWGKKVCLEITPAFSKDPRVLGLKGVQLYLKMNLKLRPGDHICIGTPFKDEAFCIGQGAKVEPGQYADDVRLE